VTTKAGRTQVKCHAQHTTSYMSIRSTSLCRASIRQLTHQFAQSSFHRPTLFSPRTFTTSTFKMAPPAPAGLFSNRYKLEDIPDLSGKVAVVTGGTRGIGESLVAALAKKNAESGFLNMPAISILTFQSTSSALRSNTGKRRSKRSPTKLLDRDPSSTSTKSTSDPFKMSSTSSPL
jgi:hypothetical protein